jgi:hypothetical protein
MRAVINLDENFKPFGKEFTELEYQKFSFPSGCEPHIKIIEKSWMIGNNEVIITTRIKSSDDLMILLLATDALKRLGFTYIKLFIPYLPFARQDRVMVGGEPLSIKVIANIINSQEYTKVAVYDAHSEVSLALINNCDPVTDDGTKKSARGYLHVYAKDSLTYGLKDKCSRNLEETGLLTTVYKNGDLVKTNTLNEIREKINNYSKLVQETVA